MTSSEKIAIEVYDECGEDYVGLWQIFRSLAETHESMQTTVAEVIATTRRVLNMPGIHLGQFDGETFVPWVGDTAELLERLERQLLSLGRDPDIGEVAWLTRD